MVVTVDGELYGRQLSSRMVAIPTRNFVRPVKKAEDLPRARRGRELNIRFGRGNQSRGQIFRNRVVHTARKLISRGEFLLAKRSGRRWILKITTGVIADLRSFRAPWYTLYSTATHSTEQS